MDKIQQRRTSATATGISKPPGVMNSAFDTGAAGAAGAKEKRGGAVHLLPPIDLSKLKAVTGPAPANHLRPAKGTTKYDGLFDMLTADNTGQVGIPLEYRQAIVSAAVKYLRLHPALSKSRIVVRLDGAGTLGVWREARQAGGK